jgi:hypothetical protein
VLHILFESYPLTHYILNDHYKADLNDTNSRFKGSILVSYVKLLVMNKNSLQVVAPFDLL